MPVLERYLTILGTIASIAVLLGLLGTVIGMIQNLQRHCGSRLRPTRGTRQRHR